MKKKAIIVDIDGTISNSEKRHLHAESIARGDWSWFAEKIPFYPTIEATTQIVKMIKKNKIAKILYLTVRGENDRDATEAWLKKHDLWDGILLMRPEGCRNKSDAEEKEEHLVQILERYNVVAVLDDSISCIEMFKKYGITTLHVSIGKHNESNFN